MREKARPAEGVTLSGVSFEISTVYGHTLESPGGNGTGFPVSDISEWAPKVHGRFRLNLSGKRTEDFLRISF